jgi:hypothetical protein
VITIQKAEHAIASVAHDIVKIARAVVPVLQKVQGQEATVEALTSLVDPIRIVGQTVPTALPRTLVLPPIRGRAPRAGPQEPAPGV